VSWTRRWHRAGSSLLLIASGMQLALHWQLYVAVDGFDAPRRTLMAAMQAYELYGPLGTSMWTALGFFSLAYAALLALFGTSHWILAREADVRTLRRHALRNTVLLVGLTLAAAALHPLPQGLAVLGLATLLFGLAAVPRPGDV
jgi:hypothetical protein